MLLRFLLIAFLSVVCVSKGVPAKIHDTPEDELDELIAEYNDVLAHESSLYNVFNDLSKDQRQELDRILSKRPRVSREFKAALDKLARLMPKELQETQQETLKRHKVLFALEAKLAIKSLKGKKLSKSTVDVLKPIMILCMREFEKVDLAINKVDAGMRHTAKEFRDIVHCDQGPGMGVWG